MHLTDRRGISAAALPLTLLLGLPLVGCTDDDGGSSGPRVTAPAAGSVVSGTVTIAWTDIDGSNVQVLLSSDSGATFSTELAASTPNDGGFPFDTTTQTDGSGYRARIVSDNSASGGDFTIDNTAPVTTLQFPNGGDFAGQSSEIRWTTTDANLGTVEILASSDGGANFDIPIANGAPDTGTFAWDATSLTEGTTYRIQITSTDAAGNAATPAASSGDFTLDLVAPTVTLTAPNGGENLTGISAATWTTTDANPGTVTITASSDSGATFPTSVAEAVSDTGTFAWRTGLLPDTMTARLRIVATDLAGNVSAADDSDADFSVENMRLIEVGQLSDVNGNALVDAGDTLLLRFDKFVALNGAMGSDLTLSVAGDSLGTGATLAIGIDPDSVLVTLGTSPTLRHRGVFSEQALAAGAPSGIDVSSSMTPNAIESTTGVDASPSTPVDLRPRAVDQAPTAVVAVTGRRGALADLDSDGDLDLVVAVTGGSASQVWQNDGGGGFTALAGFDADDTRDVALADVDGDGLIDAITATVGPNRVWTGNGMGGFADSGQSLGSAGTQAVALGDLDGDGDLDAFFGNGGVAAMADTVWLNDGTGAFANTGQSLGGSNSSSVALGDLDGDGDLDAFVAHLGDSNSQVYLNNGAGVFAAGDTTLVTAAQDVQMGDLDADGDLDLWVSANGQNQVFFNFGDGTFSSPPIFYGNNDNRGAALLDYDGDGDLDAISGKNLDSTRYWLNDGSGVFAVDTVDAEVDLAVDIAAGRIDGDSDVDLVVIVDMGAHRAYRSSASGGQPNAAFTSTTLDGAAALTAAAATGDVDRDGDVDVVTVVESVGNQVLTSNRDGTFTLLGTFGSTASAGGTLFDADGDGDLDYLERIGDATTGVDILYLGDGAGGFTAAASALNVGAWPIGDVDGDGDADLAVSDGLALEIFDGDGDGGFTASGSTFAGVPDDAGVLPFDFDGDGDVDLVMNSGSDLAVLENDGSGGFTLATTSIGDAGASLAIGDREGDGDPDVLSGRPSPLSPAWLVNDGSPMTWATAPATVRTDTFSQLALLDVNEDGDLDILGYDPNDAEIIYLPTGGADVVFSGQPYAGFGVLDADLDGDVDVYIANGSGGMPTPAQDELLTLD
ncbi:MAG: VCBS repeat-containing protein [Planctomycetota bacterium]